MTRTQVSLRLGSRWIIFPQTRLDHFFVFSLCVCTTCFFLSPLTPLFSLRLFYSVLLLFGFITLAVCLLPTCFFRSVLCVIVTRVMHFPPPHKQSVSWRICTPPLHTIIFLFYWFFLWLFLCVSQSLCVCAFCFVFVRLSVRNFPCVPPESMRYSCRLYWLCLQVKAYPRVAALGQLV